MCLHSGFTTRFGLLHISRICASVCLFVTEASLASIGFSGFSGAPSAGKERLSMCMSSSYTSALRHEHGVCSSWSRVRTAIEQHADELRAAFVRSKREWRFKISRFRIHVRFEL